MKMPEKHVDHYTAIIEAKFIIIHAINGRATAGNRWRAVTPNMAKFVPRIDKLSSFIASAAG